MGSCQVVHRGGTRRSCVSAPENRVVAARQPPVVTNQMTGTFGRGLDKLHAATREPGGRRPAAAGCYEPDDRNFWSWVGQTPRGHAEEPVAPVVLDRCHHCRRCHRVRRRRRHRQRAAEEPVAPVVLDRCHHCRRCHRVRRRRRHRQRAAAPAAGRQSNSASRSLGPCRPLESPGAPSSAPSSGGGKAVEQCLAFAWSLSTP